MSEPIKLVLSDGVATLTLNRPKTHNALNAAMTELLLQALQKLNTNASVRVIVLAATGKDFCAGVDLKWMTVKSQTQQSNSNSPGLQLATLLHALYHISKPSIALIQGHVYGGGIGLLACCDIVLASPETNFCFSEVRLGLIPAVISPYVVTAIGARAARRYCLSAESFTAQQACEMGLVHEVLQANQMQPYSNKLCQKLIAAGPTALSRTKQLINDVEHCPLDNSIKEQTASWLTAVADDVEAREGIQAFLQKRPPAWPGSSK